MRQTTVSVSHKNLNKEQYVFIFIAMTELPSVCSRQCLLIKYYFSYPQIYHIKNHSKNSFSQFYLYQRKLYYNHRYRGENQTPYTYTVMASSAMGLNLGVFGFLSTKHAKANAKQMHAQSSCAVRLLVCNCFHAQPAVHAINLRI